MTDKVMMRIQICLAQTQNTTEFLPEENRAPALKMAANLITMTAVKSSYCRHVH